jgi:hypothetical protein
MSMGGANYIKEGQIMEIMWLPHMKIEIMWLPHMKIVIPYAKAT